MANDDAWQAGMDIASKHNEKKAWAQPKQKKKKKDVEKVFTSDGQELTPTASAKPSTFKKGGKVKKSGYAKVHKGEKVLTAREAKSYKKKSSKKTHGKRVTKR